MLLLDLMLVVAFAPGSSVCMISVSVGTCRGKRAFHARAEEYAMPSRYQLLQREWLAPPPKICSVMLQWHLSNGGFAVVEKLMQGLHGDLPPLPLRNKREGWCIAYQNLIYVLPLGGCFNDCNGVTSMEHTTHWLVQSTGGEFMPQVSSKAKATRMALKPSILQ